MLGKSYKEKHTQRERNKKMNTTNKENKFTDSTKAKLTEMLFGINIIHEDDFVKLLILDLEFRNALLDTVSSKVKVDNELGVMLDINKVMELFSEVGFDWHLINENSLELTYIRSSFFKACKKLMNELVYIDDISNDDLLEMLIKDADYIHAFNKPANNRQGWLLNQEAILEAMELIEFKPVYADESSSQEIVKFYKDKYYVIYDYQYDGYRDYYGRDKDDLAAEYADRWFEINYESERTEFEYQQSIGKYPKDLSQKEIENILEDQFKKRDNFEYLSEHDFGIQTMNRQRKEALDHYFTNDDSAIYVEVHELEKIEEKQRKENLLWN